MVIAAERECSLHARSDAIDPISDIGRREGALRPVRRDAGSASIHNNSGSPIGLVSPSVAGWTCGRPTLEGEVQREAAGLDIAARRRGGRMAAGGTSANPAAIIDRAAIERDVPKPPFGQRAAPVPSAGITLSPDHHPCGLSACLAGTLAYQAWSHCTWEE